MRVLRTWKINGGDTMEKLKRRVAALESANPPAEEMTIIWRIVSPGRLDDEIYGLRGDDGNLWTRQLGETEQELIDRASKEVQRNSWGAARLITASADECRGAHHD